MKRAASVFQKEQRRAVAAAIAEAEAATSAEIVVVVASRSGRYDRGEDLFGLTLALVAVMLGWFLLPRGGEEPQWETFWSTALPPLLTAAFFLAVFAVGTVVAGRFFVLARPFVRRTEMLEEVRRTASEAFVRYRVGRTARGTGMLIFASLAEHRVWVVGDDAVNEKIDEQVWSAARDRVVDGFRGGDPARGLAEAVRVCAGPLAEAFPIGEDDVNELKNELIVLD